MPRFARRLLSAAGWAGLVFLGLAMACSGGGVPSRAEVLEAVLASTAPDTDGDGIPDDVEQKYQAVLGTDWTKRDSDGDGIDDGAEVFGDGWLYLFTRGQAGAFDGGAPAGSATSNTTRHELEDTDSDGDGVPDYLELAGYRYDWGQSKFVLDPEGFHTDPMQYSTDQDAYSDGMEVSGLNMDVAVWEPGNDPLVPAYPDLSVELLGYAVTLNTEVTSTTGGSREVGTSWNRETSSSHSLSFEAGLEVKSSVSIGADLSASVEVTRSFKFGYTDTDSVAVSSGGNTNEAYNWNESRMSNPSQAATLKLYVKVRNQGTAPASNVVPTLSLRIGGADVATFEPPDLSVAMLLPGGQFPPDPGVAWVVDRIGQDRPLMLTDWELRALESGAPVSISVAQKRADVMRLSSTGEWVRVGDANDYLARIVSSSAELFVDVGSGPDREAGQFIHRRVAAGDGPTAPKVTLGKALAVAMGFRHRPDAGYSVDLPLENGAVQAVPLVGTSLDDGMWRWQLDPFTVAGNAAGTALLDLKLNQYSQVSLRAPRQLSEPGPRVHSAYAEPVSDGYKVQACVSDYDGVARVLYLPADGGQPTALLNDGRGPWFYSLHLPSGAVTDGRDAVRVESVRTRALADGGTAPLATEAPVTVVFTPTARPPVLEGFLYANPWLYLRAKPASGQAMDQLDWVKLITAAGGAFDIPVVVNTFEDPWGRSVNLNTAGGYLASTRVVAHTVGGKYTAISLAEVTGLFSYGAGVALGASYDYTGADSWGFNLAELDRPAAEVWGWGVEDQDDYGGPGAHIYWWKAHVSPSGNPANWVPAYGLPDVYLRDTGWQCRYFYLGFFQNAAQYTGHGDQAYQALTREAVRAYPLSAGYLVNGVELVYLFGVDDIFLFRTTEGRPGKLIVRSSSVNWSDWGNWCNDTITFDYVVYQP